MLKKLLPRLFNIFNIKKQPSQNFEFIFIIEVNCPNCFVELYLQYSTNESTSKAIQQNFILLTATLELLSKKANITIGRAKTKKYIAYFACLSHLW